MKSLRKKRRTKKDIAREKAMKNCPGEHTIYYTENNWDGIDIGPMFLSETGKKMVYVSVYDGENNIDISIYDPAVLEDLSNTFSDMAMWMTRKDT